ncbi:MAG: GspB domain-containing protein [Gammaproteobacteria bacterium]|nr:GspB domain-containing protein [Gammaproteobacteria bacterium]
MSTILDALKKSEQERKLNDVPTLADMPAPEEPKRWPFFAAIAACVALLIVIAVLIMRLPSEPAPTQPVVISNESLEQQTEQLANQEIVINVVSYAEQAEQRFVMINGKMYRQNDFVRPGLKVVEIKQQSVILNERGRRIERQP